MSRYHEKTTTQAVARVHMFERVAEPTNWSLSGMPLLVYLVSF